MHAPDRLPSNSKLQNDQALADAGLRPAAANPVNNIASPILMPSVLERKPSPELDESEWAILPIIEPIAGPGPASSSIAGHGQASEKAPKKPSLFGRIFSKKDRGVFARIEAEEKREADEKAKQAAAAMLGKTIPKLAPEPMPGQVQIEPIERPREAGQPPVVKEPLIQLQVVPVSQHRASTHAVELVHPRRIFNEPYVNRALETFDTMTENIADCLFKKLVNPALGTVQKSMEDLPELLKKAAGFVLNLGDIADKEFGRLFDQQLIEPVISKDFSFMLEWMTSNEFIADNQIEDYKQKLHKKISDELEPGLPPFQKEYLTQTLLWILNRKNTKPFAEYINELVQDNTHKHVQAKEVCRKVMKALVDVKVSQYCEYMKDLLQNRLGNLLLKQMRDDTICPLVRVETEHLMDVIRRIGWTNIIDNGVVTTLYEHTNAYLAGENAVKEFESQGITKDKRRCIKKLEEYRNSPENMDAIEVSEVLQNQENIEKWKVEITVLQQNAFWKASGTHKNHFGSDTIHPVVRNIIADKLNKKEANRADLDAQLETETFFIDKADKIVEILFSSEMNEIDFWIKHLSLTKEFKDLFVRAVGLVSTFLAGKKVMKILEEGVKSEWTKTFLNAITTSVIHSAKSTLKIILTDRLKKQLERYSDPDELKEIMANKVLHEVLVPKMIQIMAQNQVFKYMTNVYAEMFLSVLQSQEQITENVQLNKLLEKMYADTREAFPSVKFQEIGMDLAAFKKAIDPFISTIIKKVRDGEMVKLSKESIIDLMQNYNSETIQADDRKQYGALIQNLVLRMSTLSTAWLASAAERYDEKVRKILSDIFVASMHDTRISPAFTVDMLMDTFKTMFAAGDPVEEMIFGAAGSTRQELRNELKGLVDTKESLERDSYHGERQGEIDDVQKAIDEHKLNKTDKKFKSHLRNVTNLIYDIAMGAIADGVQAKAPTGTKYIASWVATFSARKLALGTPDEFNAVVLDLFNKLLGDQLRNESLVYQIVNQVVNELFQISRNVRLGKEQEKRAKDNAALERPGPVERKSGHKKTASASF